MYHRQCGFLPLTRYMAYKRNMPNPLMCNSLKVSRKSTTKMYLSTHCWCFFCYCCLVYNTMIGEILNSMLGYIGLPDILQKIIQVCQLYTRTYLSPLIAHNVPILFKVACTCSLIMSQTCLYYSVWHFLQESFITKFGMTVGGTRCCLWLKHSQSNSPQGHTKRFSLYLRIEQSGSGWKATGCPKRMGAQ